VPHSPLAADRIAFWTRLHQRLDALSNRIDTVQRGAILAAIHARIPMPTPDDQQAVQLEHAQADAKFWQALAEGQAEDIEAHKGLVATAQRDLGERAAAEIAAKAEAARDRVARTERGEAVAVPPPLTRKDMLRITGMTEAEARHCERVHEIAERGGLQLLLNEEHRRRRQAEKAVVRELHRMLADPLYVLRRLRHADCGGEAASVELHSRVEGGHRRHRLRRIVLRDDR
jgi:hypothetical protein